MGRESILDAFDRLNVWSRGDQRAPHKPLLVLYALGRWSRGEAGGVLFRDVDRDLTPMLREFGPPRQSYHPQYPFWRLQNDGVWTVTAAGTLKAHKGNTDPPKGELLAHDARGGFSPEVQAALRADPRLAASGRWP
jgi:putative restriction endonuclease